MDAIVTAGGIPEPGEPLYPYTKGGQKALLDVAGSSLTDEELDRMRQLIDRARKEDR